MDKSTFNTREKRSKFYNSKQWRNIRQYILNREPLCAMCLIKDKLSPATEIDHIIPLVMRSDLCLDPANLQGLCHSCHNEKTIMEVKDKKKINKYGIYNGMWDI